MGLLPVWILQEVSKYFNSKSKLKTTHWVQWWRWWVCCQWTWSCSRWWQAVSHPSCTGHGPSWNDGEAGEAQQTAHDQQLGWHENEGGGMDQSWRLFWTLENVNQCTLKWHNCFLLFRFLSSPLSWSTVTINW